MSGKRKSYSDSFKLQVVLESLQRDTTIEAVCQKYGVNASVLNRWRHQFRERAATIFSDQRSTAGKAKAKGFKPGQSPDDLKLMIGELTVENDILKKASGLLGLK